MPVFGIDTEPCTFVPAPFAATAVTIQLAAISRSPDDETTNSRHVSPFGSPVNLACSLVPHGAETSVATPDTPVAESLAWMTVPAGAVDAGGCATGVPPVPPPSATAVITGAATSATRPAATASVRRRRAA